jgi:hypothetical protein
MGNGLDILQRRVVSAALPKSIEVFIGNGS